MTTRYPGESYGTQAHLHADYDNPDCDNLRHRKLQSGLLYANNFCQFEANSPKQELRLSVLIAARTGFCDLKW